VAEKRPSEPVRSPITRAIREALEAIASPEIAEAIFHEALAYGGFDGPPTDAAGLERLVHVELADTTRRTLGAEAAEVLVERLGPLVELVARMEPEGVRPRGAAPAGATHPIEFRPFHLVLGLSLHPGDAATLAETVGKPTSVVPMRDGRALASGLELLRGQAKMVIVDCREDASAADPIFTCEAEVLDQALVLLWGAPADVAAELAAHAPRARFVECDAEASARDLATIAKLGPG
jgi:hypothetical protein